MKKVYQLPSFDLQKLEEIPLQRRVDIKFLIPKLKFDIFINQLFEAQAAHALEVNGNRVTNYSNQYFDTPDFAFYHDHHARKLNRIKIRARSYSTTGMAYLEEKMRTNKDKVEKLRIPYNQNEDFPFEELRKRSKYLHKYKNLNKTIDISYSRITIASKYFKEKATFDFNLTHTANGKTLTYGDMVIAEVKQPSISLRSDFMKLLKDLKCYPISFSKYCSGISQLYPEVKKNNFLPLLRILNKEFKLEAV